MVILSMEKVPAEVGTWEMLKGSGPEMKTHQTVRSIGKMTLQLLLTLLRTDTRQLTWWEHINRCLRASSVTAPSHQRLTTHTPQSEKTL